MTDYPDLINRWKILLFVVGLTLGAIVLFGGGIFIFNVINSLIIEPIKGGRMTAITLLMLLVFIAMLFNKFRHRSSAELGTARVIEETKGMRKQRLF
jgi:hypothetical protein